MRRRGYRRRPGREGRSLIRVVPVDAAVALSLRWRVLRPGRPEADAIFPQDELPDTVHLGAFDAGRLVAVGTFFPDACPGREDLPAWRLRGMATVEDRRGGGSGRAVLERGLVLAKERGATVVWCNGRLPAVGFYVKLGFEIDSGLFDPHGTGPHHRLVRDLRRGA